ncbi:MAG: leishmanolysin-related zinc metalloendopeptidase, partial [Gemmatimonadota bacterium]
PVTRTVASPLSARIPRRRQRVPTPTMCIISWRTTACRGGAVPAENCLDLDAALTCGAGTIDSHWKESVFQGELMTGYLQTTNPLSKMTLQSLADLGYIVSLTTAEPYTVPTPPVAIGAGAIGASLHGISEELIVLGAPMAPRFVVDELGRTTPIRYR